MILKKKYIENEKLQKIWYDSSMLVYSEMKENEFENIGDLTITFKNGATYVYMDVSFEDYMVFIGGGTDASQGKTLNKIIKNKYQYKRIEDKNVQDLLNELNQKEENNEYYNTYFISGHRNLTENEFEFYYIPLINEAIKECSEAKFVIGDSNGCDIMAQNYLIDVLNFNPEDITVYCVGETPEYIHPKIVNFKNGFLTHDEKDESMTKNSFKDIAMVRNWNELTGTAQNILRRNSFNSI